MVSQGTSFSLLDWSSDIQMMLPMRFAGFLLAALSTWAPSPAMAQAATEPVLPRMADGHPDFNGVWSGRGHADMSTDTPGGLPFTDAGKAAFADVKNQYDPTGFCLYPGVTRIVGSPYPTEFVQTPNRVVILYEYMRTFRVIPTDGRTHGADLNPNFFGDSVGTWDGDTLVVDVKGFNEKSWLDPAGHPHSDALHLIERYRLTDANHIAHEVTVDDPKMYTKLWKSSMVFTRKPDWEIIEYSCDENNKDRDNHHFQPGPSFDPNRPRVR
jgi:hypothetical protein